jgi:hypothetical protein
MTTLRGHVEPTAAARAPVPRSARPPPQSEPDSTVGAGEQRATWSYLFSQEKHPLQRGYECTTPMHGQRARYSTDGGSACGRQPAAHACRCRRRGGLVNITAECMPCVARERHAALADDARGDRPWPSLEPPPVASKSRPS